MATTKSNRSKSGGRSVQAASKNQGGPSKAAQSKGGQHSHGGKGKR